MPVFACATKRGHARTHCERNLTHLRDAILAVARKRSLHACSHTMQTGQFEGGDGEGARARERARGWERADQMQRHRDRDRDRDREGDVQEGRRRGKSCGVGVRCVELRVARGDRNKHRWNRNLFSLTAASLVYTSKESGSIKPSSRVTSSALSMLLAST